MIQRWVEVFLSGVIAVAVMGYFVGMMDGVPQPDGLDSPTLLTHFDNLDAGADSKLIPAVSYAEVPAAMMGPTDAFQASAKQLLQSEYDLFAEIKPSEAEKEASSKLRATRRAYNGAPPIIPHAIENTSDAACYACHSNGMKMAGLKASVMSHSFLANCTQCHAPPPPTPFANVDVSVDSSFVGLPAPKSGKRAFAGAPPAIPHSQWMRENCNACHGGPNGWAGMESTHPWRTNCSQCHAPSAVLDQAISVAEVPMLPPLDVAAK
jgi:nitrate reductase (cytochrome), electron transfer subunit